MRTEVRRTNLQDRVQLLGDRSDVPELLARSSVLVLMSRFEGLPISVLEGMRAGLPVVASHVGGLPELVEEGRNGFLVPSGDVKALRAAMLRLIRSPDLRAQMGVASRDRFNRQFREDLMLRRIRDTYAAVLNEASRQASG